jgi:hypothetical protein
MLKDAKLISRAFDIIDEACYQIAEVRDACKGCPIKGLCLRGEYGDATVEEIADLMAAESWDEFLRYADSCLPSEELIEGQAENAKYDEWKDRCIDG